MNNIYNENVVEWTVITREPQSAVPAECVIKGPFSRVQIGTARVYVWRGDVCSLETGVISAWSV
jgi:hypothetical protein